MNDQADIIWAATPISRRGNRFYPYNWGMFASLTSLDNGDFRYSSGGSYDPYRIRACDLAETLAGLCRPSDVAESFGLSTQPSQANHRV